MIEPPQYNENNEYTETEFWVLFSPVPLPVDAFPPRLCFAPTTVVTKLLFAYCHESFMQKNR